MNNTLIDQQLPPLPPTNLKEPTLANFTVKLIHINHYLNQRKQSNASPVTHKPTHHPSPFRAMMLGAKSKKKISIKMNANLDNSTVHFQNYTQTKEKSKRILIEQRTREVYSCFELLSPLRKRETNPEGNSLRIDRLQSIRVRTAIREGQFTKRYREKHRTVQLYENSKFAHIGMIPSCIEFEREAVYRQRKWLVSAINKRVYRAYDLSV